MIMLKVLILGFTIAQLCKCATIEEPNVITDYSDYKLIRIHPVDQKDVETLMRFQDEYKLDYWSHPSTDTALLTHVSDKNFDFLIALKKSLIHYEIVSDNLQQVFDAQRLESERIKSNSKAFDYAAYHTYEEIVTELSDIAGRSSLAQKISVGTSYEGRDIAALKVTSQSGSGKRSVILECGIHAREWITPASCMWIINDLVTNAGNQQLLDKYEFYIVPSLNVDGYVYTWTTSRMWRKTRRPNRGSSCRGADPNRNWDAGWGGPGASGNPCDETYYGDSVNSEPEIKAFSEFIAAKASNTAAYFTIHNYGQMWMYAWGYTTAKPPQDAQLNKLSSDAVTAIRNAYAKSYKYGTIANTIYVSSGCSTDFAYSKGIIPAFAIELRDTGTYGFALPASQIEQTADELFRGMKAVINQI